MAVIVVMMAVIVVSDGDDCGVDGDGSDGGNGTG